MPFSIYEAIMLLCFGAAWPFSIIRSWRSRSTKGKSLPFLLIILVGYLAGIMHKFHQGQTHDPVLILYILNTIMVTIDTTLYLRNRNSQ